MEQKKNKNILLILFLGVLMGALDIAIVGPALPAIEQTFGVSQRSLSWIFNIYVLFYIISIPLMAKLSDKYGRRLTFIMDLLLFAFGSFLVTLSPSFITLIIGRSIQGFGAGGIFPVATAVIGDLFPKEKRGSALGIIGAVFGLAFIIGPMLGGFLLLINWRWLFFINIPIAGLIIILASIFIPNYKISVGKSFDFRGMVILIIILSSFALGLNQIDESRLLISLISFQVWPFLVIAIILLPIYIKIELKTHNPIISIQILTERKLVLPNLLSLGAGFVEATLIFLPTLAVFAFGFTFSTASFMILPLVLAMTFGAPTIGRFLDKLGAKIVITYGTIILTIGLIFLGLEGDIFIFFIIGTIIIGIGLSSLLGAPLRYIILNEAPEKDRASLQGLLSIFSSIGQLFSGALIGGLADSIGGGILGYKIAYLAIGVISIGFIIATFKLKKDNPKSVKRDLAL